MHKKIKTAILLANLGGPDQISSVKSFLFNLFYDKHIIQLSNPWRFLLAKLISCLRNRTSQEIYRQIGGKSPIVEQTLAQSEALNIALANKLHSYQVFTAMRHWHPLISSVVAEIKYYQPEEIILVPLYPQFSTSTTLSAVEELQKQVIKYGMKSNIKTICCYPVDSGFVNGYIERIKPYLVKKQNTIFLFSAHGLPQKFIDQGDPYQWQVENTVNAIIHSLGIKDFDWKISYQSRVGPLKWIGPDTQSEIITAAQRNKNIVVIPISFVSEHVETLVELDIEYANLAYRYNVKYQRVPTVGINKLFITGLANMIATSTASNGNFTSCYGIRGCPKQFTKCIFKDG